LRDTGRQRVTLCHNRKETIALAALVAEAQGEIDEIA